MKRALIASLLAALTLASAASAATLDDVRALGYQVGVAQSAAGCTNYSISGFGVSVYANTCDAGYQSTLDSLANPAAHCNRVWQTGHPDQLASAQTAEAKGYYVNGDKCADSFTVTNRYTAEVVYTGNGAGLISASASLAPLEAPAQAPAAAPAAPAPAPAGSAPTTDPRVAALEAEVARLQAELDSLRAEFVTLRDALIEGTGSSIEATRMANAILDAAA